MKILQEFRGAVSVYGLSKKSSACFGQHTAYVEAELEVALCETGRTRWGFGVPDCIALSSVRTWRTWCCKKQYARSALHRDPTRKSWPMPYDDAAGWVCTCQLDRHGTAWELDLSVIHHWAPSIVLCTLPQRHSQPPTNGSLIPWALTSLRLSENCPKIFPFYHTSWEVCTYWSWFGYWSL